MWVLIYVIIANLLTAIVMYNSSMVTSKEEAIISVSLGWIVLPIAISCYIWDKMKERIVK